jgi:lipopolysaccharide transport system ATP-binding protein
VAHIQLHDVCVDLPVFGAHSRSLKNRIISAATGGRLAKEAGVTFVRALSHVNLELRAGDRVGLWGHNGAGKTTLLRVLAGAYTPSQGTLTIEGEVTSLIDLQLGMEPEATGYENVALRLMMMGRDPDLAARITTEVETFSGLGDFLDLPIRTYSSGMLMRLAFAISTSVEPEILLMDEWLSVGDQEFLARAEARLEELVTRTQILVIASHSRQMLERRCNRILMLDHGTVTEEPAPAATESSRAAE